MVQKALKMAGRGCMIICCMLFLWACAYVYGWLTGAHNLSWSSFHAGYLYVIGIMAFLGLFWLVGSCLRPKEAPDEVMPAIEAEINFCLRAIALVILFALGAPIACYWSSVFLDMLQWHETAAQLYAFRYLSALFVLFGVPACWIWLYKPQPPSRRHVPPNTF